MPSASRGLINYGKAHAPAVAHDDSVLHALSEELSHVCLVFVPVAHDERIHTASPLLTPASDQPAKPPYTRSHEGSTLY